MDLDPANFTDEAFQSYASIRPGGSGDTSATGGNKKIKDADMNTDDVFYNDAETNTKFKKTGVSVSLRSYNINHQYNKTFKYCPSPFIHFQTRFI